MTEIMAVTIDDDVGEIIFWSMKLLVSKYRKIMKNTLIMKNDTLIYRLSTTSPTTNTSIITILNKIQETDVIINIK